MLQFASDASGRCFRGKKVASELGSGNNFLVRHLFKKYLEIHENCFARIKTHGNVAQHMLYSIMSKYFECNDKNYVK